MADFVFPGGGGVTAIFPVDPVTKEPIGPANPGSVKAVNTQTRQANITAMPAFYILAKDVNGNDALMGVSAVSRGTEGFATGQATLTTAATLIVPARVGRSAVTIFNGGTTDSFLGGSAVTTGNGSLLVGTKGASVTIPTGAAIYGVVGTGTQAVSYMETF